MATSKPVALRLMRTKSRADGAPGIQTKARCFTEMSRYSAG
jgi:hypothetical protein